MPDPHQQLIPHLQRLHRLRGAMALLSWDQEVTMPAAGTASRAGHRATFAEIIHAQITDPSLGEILDALAPNLQIHVVTADTFGKARAQLQECPCQTVVLPDDKQDVGKLAYVRRLGPEATAS